MGQALHMLFFTNLSSYAGVMVLKQETPKPSGKSTDFKHGNLCFLGSTIDPRDKERHGKVDDLAATKESGAVLSCLARHRLTGSEEHLPQLRHHPFNVHQLEHALREDWDEEAVEGGFPILTPFQPPPRIGRGVCKLVGKSVRIVLVDPKLDEKPKQGAKTVLPPLTPGSGAPSSKSSTAEDVVEMSKTAGSNELSNPTCGSVGKRGSWSRGRRVLTVAQSGMTSQSSWTTKPVDDIEGVKEPLRRLRVEQGGEVAVRVDLLQALLDLRVGGEEEQDLPDSSRHDLSLCVQSQSMLAPAWDPTELGHEGEELGEVVLLEEQQHGDLVSAREGRQFSTELAETSH